MSEKMFIHCVLALIGRTIFFRSTTSKRPQPKPTDSDAEYNDQKFSFTKNNKVKSPVRDVFDQPIHQYRINISHNGAEPTRASDLSVKSLDAYRKEQSPEVEDDDDIDYVEYDDDEDYGVILTEQDRLVKEKSTAKPTTSEQPSTTSAPQTTTTKPEDNTVIIFENFILPNRNENKDEDNEDEGEDFDYEYIEEDEEPKTTEKPLVVTEQSVENKTSTPDNMEVTTYRDANRILGQAVVSVVTSKTVVNGSMPKSDEESVIETTTEEENYPSSTKPAARKTTTEDYYVVASVQTSRSVSGAHFLPFEHVEQEERKKSRNELGNKKQQDINTEEPEARTHVSEVENVSSEVQDEDEDRIPHDYTTSGAFDDYATTLATTQKYALLPSTESIIDKLDRVQSDLSLGVLSGEFPILKDRTLKKLKVTTTKAPHVEIVEEDDEAEEVETPVPSTVKPLVLIRKFSPKSSATTTRKPTTTQKVNVKSSSITTTTEEATTTTLNNSVVESSRENKKIAFEAIPQDDLIGLLPAGYKPRNSFKNKKLLSSTSTQPPIVKEDLPTKSRNSTISRSYKPQSGSQLLNSPSLKGFKNKDKHASSKAAEENETENVPKKTFNKSSDVAVDLKKFLPPGFKPTDDDEQLAVIPLGTDELSKFLPPGFKLVPTTEKPKIKVLSDEISKFLPPGYKPEKEEKKADDVLSSILGKIKFQTADLLPSDFKESVSETPVYKPTTTEAPTTVKASGKVVFPNRPGIKRPGSGRSTTPKPVHAEGPKAPELEIRRGPPTRATTEFTGWPSKATTPISIERLLELQRSAVEINIADLLPKSTTTETPSTSTTTTTTTPRPTQPTVCRSECSLAATIRIIDGVEWSPELLTHHTEEYKNLAAELEIELNEVYSNAPSLKQWFKKVRIDSFSKGSVLVDYFVELSDLPKDINTVEIKHMFHEALVPVPERSQSESEEEEGSPQPIVKEAFKLGNFLVDPVSTDFIGTKL